VKIDTTNTDYTAMLRTAWLKKTTLNTVLHKTQQLNNCFIACTCGVRTLIKQTINNCWLKTRIHYTHCMLYWVV